MRTTSVLWHDANYVKVRTDAAVRRGQNQPGLMQDARPQTRTIMKTTPDVTLRERLEREVERERQERVLLDDARAGLAVDDEFRSKDARENMGAVKIRRARGR